MGVAWITPVVADASKWMSDAVLAATNSDPDSAARMTTQLPAAVERIRGAIRSGRKTPLSATAGSIPPSAKHHCFVLAAYSCVNAIPQVGDYATKDGFTRMWEEAEEWLKRIADPKQGEEVEDPLDPDLTSVNNKSVFVASGGTRLTRDLMSGL